MTRLSPIDAGFLLTESPQSPKHVAGLQVFRLPPRKGPAWLRRMIADLRAAPPGFPFNCKLDGARSLQPELVPDPHLEPDYHVRHTVLPRPGDDDQLLELVARLHANLLDRDRPLWEFHLIEGLSDRRFAFYTKVHHALCDGVTFTRWFMQSGSTDPSDTATRPIWQRDESPRPAGDDPGYVDLIRSGIGALGGGLQTTVGLSRLSARMLTRRFWQRDDRIAMPLGAPRTPLNAPPGAARAVRTTSWPLERLRTTARRLECTINDLLMTICDLAVSRYFEETGVAVDDPLVAYMPVNLRTAGDDTDGNLVSLLQVRLAPEHDDPVAALRTVAASIRAAREVFGGLSRPAIQTYAVLVALIAQVEETLNLGSVLPPAHNLVISNVPGPRHAMYFRGAETLAVYPVSTLPPMTALNVTASSYAGTLYVGLIAARSVISDLSRLTELMDDACAALVAADGD